MKNFTQILPTLSFEKIKVILLIFLIQNYAFSQCFKEISASVFNTFAIKQDGTLWAWGSNEYGQFGDGTQIQSSIPKQSGIYNNWSKISTGQNYTMAIKTNGTLWGWGFQGYAVGDGSPTIKINPVQIGTATNWSEIKAGSYMTIGLKTNGTLWAWGANAFSSLIGSSSANDIMVPTQIGTDTNWSTIDMGDRHMVAIKTNGTLWSWGIDYSGEIGIGLTTPTVVGFPTQVGTANNWSKVSAGNYLTIGLKTDGTMYSWGRNDHGQVGDGTLINKNVPTQIGTGTNWSKVNTGGDHTLGIKTDGTLWAWGRNQLGQLGNGTQVNSNNPIQVGTANTWNLAVVGTYHTIALKINGLLSGVGWNNYGQLGDGTVGDRTILFEISCPNNLAINKNIANQDIKLYPNPVNEQLNIIFENDTLEKTIIEITDLNGRILKTNTINSENSSINTSDLSKGIYIVRVTNSGLTTNQKIIKQ